MKRQKGHAMFARLVKGLFGLIVTGVSLLLLLYLFFKLQSLRGSGDVLFTFVVVMSMLLPISMGMWGDKPAASRI